MATQTVASQKKADSLHEPGCASAVCVEVVGIIDSYGAIHYEKGYLGAPRFHAERWPGKHKRWRFDVNGWSLENSILSQGELTPEEAEAVVALMSKILPVPEWVQKNAAWEVAGRPRGRAYEAFERKWNRRKKTGERHNDQDHV